MLEPPLDNGNETERHLVTLQEGFRFKDSEEIIMRTPNHQSLALQNYSRW